MKKRKLTVKVSSVQEAMASFKNVWEKIEGGEKLAEPIEIIGFENAALLVKTLTPKRLELLQTLHAIGVSSVRALAKKLDRDYSNVHQDIKILTQVGLLLQDKKGRYSMPWDKIITEIPMTKWIAHPVRKHIPSHFHSTHR
jgi:predicted transcriptional regulator